MQIITISRLDKRPSAKLKDLQKKKDDFFEKYRFILPGYNLRSTDLNAAIGIKQIKKLDKFISIRRRNAEVYNKLFKNHEKFDIQIENSNSKTHGLHLIFSKDKI